MDDIAAWLGQQMENQRFRAEGLKTLAYALPAETGAYLTETADLLLADVDAKRRILEMHSPVVLRRVVGSGAPQDVTACEYDTDPDGAGWTDYPCETLRLLALPFAGHPGCRNEWRP